MGKLQAIKIAKMKVKFDEASKFFGYPDLARHGIFALWCVAEILCEIRDELQRRNAKPKGKS